MAYITQVRRGIDIMYVEHKEEEWKLVEQETKKGGGYEVFLWAQGPRDFLNRYRSGHWKSFGVQNSVDSSIRYIEKFNDSIIKDLEKEAI